MMIIRRRAELDTENPPGIIKNDITLGDYIDRKYPETKKLTFDEWWELCNDDDFHYMTARRVWKAAQENK